MAVEVKVVPHDPKWDRAFRSEKEAIQRIFKGIDVSIHHIGSTAIPEIVAKPIIDILLEASDLDAIDSKSKEMMSLGYECMGEFGIEGRRYFRKDDGRGIRTHQIHAFKAGSLDAIRHLAFRDYLMEHPHVAREYDKLKRKLVEEVANIEGYMDGKESFIERVEAEAIAWRRAASGEPEQSH